MHINTDINMFFVCFERETNGNLCMPVGTLTEYEYGFTCMSDCLLMFLCIQEVLKPVITMNTCTHNILSMDVETEL